jgi:hypothetical protein
MISPDILILFNSWFHPLASMGFEPSCGLFCGNPNLEPFPHALCEAKLGGQKILHLWFDATLLSFFFLSPVC